MDNALEPAANFPPLERGEVLGIQLFDMPLANHGKDFFALEAVSAYRLN